MTLTGAPLLIALISTFLGLSGLLVVYWARLGRSSVLAVLARIGSLAVLNLLLVLTAAVALNDLYLFFADWADLTGSSATTITAEGHAGGPTSAVFTGSGAAGSPFPVTGPADVATVVPATTSGQGRLLTFQVTGATSGLTGQVMVQLPESYSASGSTTRSYPVLESFPTYPGTPLSLFKNFDLTTGFTSAIGNGKVGDFLLVVPQTWFPGRADTECINGPSGTPQVEDWIAKDVPAWLAQHFRVKQDRNSWATIGVSAGAWCASMAAYLHPNLYSAAISMGGYFTPTFEGPPPFPPGSPRLARYDLTRRVAVNPPPIAMLVTTSKQDQVSYPTTSRFVAAARAPLAIDSRIFASGGHRWSQWAPLLGPALAWLGKTAPGFKP
jgi:hypothetical protein